MSVYGPLWIELFLSLDPDASVDDLWEYVDSCVAPDEPELENGSHSNILICFDLGKNLGTVAVRFNQIVQIHNDGANLDKAHIETKCI